jgi:hypothetical protein
METIKEFEYKGFPIKLYMSEHHGITFSCSSYDKFSSRHRKEHINGGWEKPDEAIESIKEVIDTFLSNSPKNYKELAIAIYDGALIWSGYEDCEIDPKLLEIIIKNFILTQKL